jgi:hypothetical protein
MQIKGLANNLFHKICEELWRSADASWPKPGQPERLQPGVCQPRDGTIPALGRSLPLAQGGAFAPVLAQILSVHIFSLWIQLLGTYPLRLLTLFSTVYVQSRVCVRIARPAQKLGSVTFPL